MHSLAGYFAGFSRECIHSHAKSRIRLGTAVSRRVSVAGALHDAARLTRHSWWRVFRMQLALIALNVCGAALLGVGLLVTLPVSILAAASLYRELQADAWGPAQESNMVRSI